MQLRQSHSLQSFVHLTLNRFLGQLLGTRTVSNLVENCILKNLQIRVLEYITDFISQISRLIIDNILAVDKNLAAARMAERHKQTAQRRLAAAVVAKQRHELAVINLAVYILNYRLTTSISKIDILRFQH